MKTKLTLLLSLTFLFLFSGSVFADSSHDAWDAVDRKDYKTAHKLWLQLAEQGHATAQGLLGFMYNNGEGVPQDYKEAVKWYRLSAEQGLAVAQSRLGLTYERGLGVPKDYVLAHMWTNLAASNGYKLAVKHRDILEKKMSD